MKNIKHTKDIKLILFLIFVGILCFTAHIIYFRHIEMPTILADEFGSIANAAYLAGADWSDVISRVGYYSYGGSMFYLPIFLFADSAENIYHEIIICNAFLLSLYYFIVYLIITRLYRDFSKYISALLALAVSLYPSYICYGYTAMYETVLVLVFAFMILMLTEFCKTKKTIYICLFSVSSGFLLMVHMRTVGVVAVSVLILIKLFLDKSINKKQIILSIFLFGIMALLFIKGKDFFYSNLWNDGNLFNGDDIPNTISSQTKKLSIIFSWYGVKSFIKLILGQSYYFVLSTMLLGGVFIYSFAKQIIIKIRRKKFFIRDTKFNIILFTGFALLAQFVISFMTHIKLVRVDQIFYGRYTEYIYGIVMVLGFMQIKKHKLKIRELSLVLLLFIIQSGCVSVIAERVTHYLSGPNIVSVTASSRFFDGSYFEVFRAAGFGILCYILICLITYIPLKHLSVITVLGMSVVFYWEGALFTEDYIIPLNNVHKNYSKLGAVISGNIGENEKISYYCDTSSLTLEKLVRFELLQYSLFDVPIEIHEYSELPEAENSIIITDNNSDILKDGIWGKYDILKYRGEILAWKKTDKKSVTFPATMFHTLCTDKTDWNEGSYTSRGEEGFLICGKSQSLEAGEYTVTYTVEIKSDGGLDDNEQLFFGDVCYFDETEQKRLSEIKVLNKDIGKNEKVQVSCNVTIPENNPPCEFRIKVNEDVIMTAYSVSVTENERIVQN